MILHWWMSLHRNTICFVASVLVNSQHDTLLWWLSFYLIWTRLRHFLAASGSDYRFVRLVIVKQGGDQVSCLGEPYTFITIAAFAREGVSSFFWLLNNMKQRIFRGCFLDCPTKICIVSEFNKTMGVCLFLASTITSIGLNRFRRLRYRYNLQIIPVEID